MRCILAPRYLLALAMIVASSQATALAAAPAGLTFECVEYARGLTRVRITGNASAWWDKAAPLYARGTMPRQGSILVLPPHAEMRLGHVAVVSQIVGPRQIMLRHANWSPVDGVRGKVEEDVPALDVSAANDWSSVRIWYGPINDLGRTHWPVTGFIYPDWKPQPDADPMQEMTRSGVAMAAPWSQAGARSGRTGMASKAGIHADPIGAIIARVMARNSSRPAVAAQPD